MSARAAVALLLAALGAGCAKELSELRPFPCAKDRTCPLGLVCDPAAGCVSAKLDALCAPDTDCGAAGAECLLGVCATRCAAGCAPGRVCASAVDGGMCVADCGDGGACPAGLACKPLWVGGRHGCLPAEVELPACQSEEALPAPACGAGSFTVTCSNGHVCAANSACKSGGVSCSCLPGFVSWNCVTHAQCSAAAPCAYPNWWCLPQGITSTCASTSGWTPANYSCADGRRLAATCGSTCQSACAEPGDCDPVRQTCGLPERSKCTFVATDAGIIATTCVPQTGQNDLGGACTMDETVAYALDDCAAGGVCSVSGAPGVPTCRKFCTNSEGCDAGFHCVAITDPPPFGECAPDCALFSNCGPQATCGPQKDIAGQGYAQCRAATAAAIGASCWVQPDCGANQVCAVATDGGSVCAAICDPAHGCDAGTCIAFGNSKLPPLTGFCQ